jgi:hypothetical protein
MLWRGVTKNVTAVTAVNVFVAEVQGLTQRKLVSTLEQSPERRRYGCDPGTTRRTRRLTIETNELTNGGRVRTGHGMSCPGRGSQMQ